MVFVRRQYIKRSGWAIQSVETSAVMCVNSRDETMNGAAMMMEDTMQCERDLIFEY